MQAQGLTPASLAGTTLAVAVADGTYPFTDSGYYLLIANNAGNNLQFANLAGFTNGSAKYTYSTDGTNAQIRMSPPAFGQIVDDLVYADSYSGNYTLTSMVFGGQQHGDFIWFNGQAPASIAGRIFSCNINDGADPFSASGSATIAIAANGNTYTITKDSATTVDSYGSCSYVRVNAATGKLVLTDSKLGTVTAYFAFADAWTGSFGFRNEATDSFEVGDFQILDTTIPAVEISAPKSGRTVSNEVLAVTGRASDNVAVAYVVYSINGFDWLAADSTNNYQTWSATVLLTPGTNLFSAYAVDASGNPSATNTSSYVYVVSAPLNIVINGRGGVAPAYNNALLQVGANYTVTAKPAAGYNFAYWSDGTNVLATRPALTFNMAVGLTLYANFVDVARPTVAITAPLAGQRLSNNVFSVAGKAADNDRVAQVFCSLNDADWTPANTGNNWANWTANAALRPGPNRLKTYALDATGNYSTTNSVDFIYVLSAPITLQVTGGGKCLPYVNGARLAIGQRYALSAVASNGYAFCYWKNADGLIVTNKSTITFAMESNLNLTACFADVARPAITIGNKPSELVGNNPWFTVKGRATDNAAVADVFFKLNDGDWQEPTTANGWTDWSAALVLSPGLNTFSCYCVDTSGNVSPTVTAKITYATAPANLNNLSVDCTSDSAQAFNLSFSAKNFCQFSADASHANGVGVYTYTRLSATTGRLRLNFTAPPAAAGIGYYDFLLDFTSATSARFNNQNAVDTGNMQLSSTPMLTITSLVKRTVVYVSNPGAGQATYFNAGKFWVTDLLTGATNGGTTLSYAMFSPIATLVKQTNSGGTFYTIAKYNGTNYGSAYVERYGTDGSLTGTELGNFGFASSQPIANAPAALANRSLSIWSGNSFFELAFADSTFGQQCPDDSFTSGAGSYSYSLADTNTGNLSLNYLAPADLNGTGSTATLSFYAPNLAYLVNADSTISAAVLSDLPGSFAVSPAGQTFLTGNTSDGLSNQYQFFGDGSFAVTGDSPASGSYSFNAYSPQTGMVQLIFASGSFAGNFGWLQLNYDSSGNGSFRATILDGGNNLLNSEHGDFSQQ